MNWILIIVAGGGLYSNTPAITQIEMRTADACLKALMNVSHLAEVKNAMCINKNTGDSVYQN